MSGLQEVRGGFCVEEASDSQSLLLLKDRQYSMHVTPSDDARHFGKWKALPYVGGITDVAGESLYTESKPC